MLDGTMRKDLIGSEHPSGLASPGQGSPKAAVAGRKTPNRNNRRLVENAEMSNRMQQALAG